MQHSGTPFIIYALPRSGTFWLSRYLTWGGYACAHEQARHVRAPADVRSWLAQDHTGTAETAAAPWWRLVQHYRPDVRTLVVRRPVAGTLPRLVECRSIYRADMVRIRLEGRVNLRMLVCGRTFDSGIRSP